MASKLILLMEELPKSPLWPHPPLNTEENVREAMALIERNIRDRAITQHAQGWVEDGDVEYSTNVDGSAVIGKLRMKR